MTIFPHGRLAQTAVFFLLLFFTACSPDNGAAGITGESFSATPEMIQAATAGALKPVMPTETARDSARPAGSSAVTVAAETVNSPVVKPTSDEDPVPTLLDAAVDADEMFTLRRAPFRGEVLRREHDHQNRGLLDVVQQVLVHVRRPIRISTIPEYIQRPLVARA